MAKLLQKKRADGAIREGEVDRCRKRGGNPKNSHRECELEDHAWPGSFGIPPLDHVQMAAIAPQTSDAITFLASAHAGWFVNIAV